MSLPIALNCHTEKYQNIYIPYVDYFNSIKKMMNTFFQMIKKKKTNITQKRNGFYITSSSCWRRVKKT